MIIKIGNYLKELKHIYELSKKYDKWIWSDFLDSSLEKSLDSLYNKLSFTFEKSSFFKKVMMPWHVDGSSFISASYPNPMQILMYQGNSVKHPIVSDFGIINKYAQNLLRLNKATIFTPLLGDVYYIPDLCLHRSNPIGKDEPHLVFRMSKKGYT